MQSKSLEHFRGDVIETLKEKKEVTDSVQKHHNQAAALTDLSKQIGSNQKTIIGGDDLSKELTETIEKKIESIQAAVQEQGEKLKRIDAILEKGRTQLEKTIKSREHDLNKIHQLAIEINVSMDGTEQGIINEITNLKNGVAVINEALLAHTPEKILEAINGIRSFL